jgi:Protein HRI1
MSDYLGLWKRESIQIGRSLPYEDATVFWLQAKTYFIDIRIPLNQASLPPGQTLQDLNPPELRQFAQFQAFAGTIDSTDRWIRWNRSIDFTPNPGCVDQGDIHFEGENLIEVGEFSKEDQLQQYREIWVPQPLSSRDYCVLELTQAVNRSTQTIATPCALLIRVGEHFMRIYDDRSYSADFAVPDPVLLAAEELQRLMQFQVDYGQHHAESLWKILLSNDPSRVGTSLCAKANYQSRWENQSLIESWSTPTGEQLEHHWKIRECNRRE